MFDRLVGGAVLAESDGVVGPDEGDGPFHQRREADGGSHVVAEGEEGAAVGPGAAVHLIPFRMEPIACSRMPKCRVRPYGLPGNSRDCRSAGRKLGSPSMVVLLDSARSAEPPHSSGSFGASAVSTLPEAARVATPLASGCPAGQRLLPAGCQLTGHQTVVEGFAVGVGLGPLVEADLPVGHRGGPATDQGPGVGEYLLRHVEGLLRVETQDLLGGGHLVGAERGAVRFSGPLGLRRRPGDDRVQLDEAGPVGDLAGRVQRCQQGRDVLGVLGVALGPVHGLHVPAVGLVAGCGVFAEGDVGVVLDGDPVAVVDHGQVAEPLGAGQRGGLGGDALLDVAVGGEHVDLVVKDRLTDRGIGVEQTPFTPGGHRHTDGVGQALTERAGRDLDTLGVAVLGVSRCRGSPGTQGFQVVQLQPEPAEIQLDVQGQAGVSAGQHETVTSRPVGVGRAVAHHLLEQGVGHRCQAHRGTGMAVARLLHGVGPQHPDGVDGPGVGVGPAVGEHE